MGRFIAYPHPQLSLATTKSFHCQLIQVPFQFRSHTYNDHPARYVIEHAIGTLTQQKAFKVPTNPIQIVLDTLT